MLKRCMAGHGSRRGLDYDHLKILCLDLQANIAQLTGCRIVKNDVFPMDPK